MYIDFFGLRCNPFQLSPDPFFMVSSDRSKEALTAISSAVGQRKGFVVMTGEVGTGKTLVLRCLFELWEREQIPFAYFIGPKLSTIDFLSYINFELGIKVSEPTKGNLLRALYGFLLAQFEKGLTTVLIIDEAHEVPRSVLEEIRLLTNFETAQQKLVQIVLVGQPELDRKLDSVELRSLKQRIAVRCKLEPLRAEEIRSYIERRLELAGANSQAATIFPVETAKAIYRYSLGLPRLVNNICDQALIAACASQIRVVPVEVIDEIASRFRLEPAPNLKQTERLFSHASQIEGFESDKSWQAAPASIAPSAKAPDPDTVLLYLDVGNGAPGQTTSPGKSETSHRSGLSDDSTAYARELGQDRDTIPEVLSELDLQSWNPEARDVRLPSDLSALSDARSSVITTSEAGLRGSSQNSALAAESIYLAPTATQLTVCDPVIQPSEIQTFRALPKTAAPTEQEGIAAKNPVDRQEERPPAPAPIQPPPRRTSVEVLDLESAPVQTEKTIEPDRASTRNNKIILIGAVAAAFLLLASGSAAYLRRHSRTSTIPPALTSAQMNTQSAAPPAQPVVSEKAASNPNPSLLAYKEIAQPSPASRKSVLRHVRFARPSVNRSAKSPDVGDPGVAPVMDGKFAPNTDGLGSELAASKQTMTPPPPLRIGGDVTSARIISSVAPVYPSLAKNQHVGGDVRIDALVDENGSVSAMKVVSGPVLLQEAAREALRQWKYQPATLDGKPVPMHLTATIQFRLE